MAVKTPTAMTPTTPKEIPTPPRAKLNNNRPNAGQGRPKGTPNRNLWSLRERLQEIGFDPMLEFVKLYDETQFAADRLDQLKFLFKYIYPQLKEADAPPAPVVIDVTAEIATTDLLTLAK